MGEKEWEEDEILACLRRIGIENHDPLTCPICLHIGNWDVASDVTQWFQAHWEAERGSAKPA